MSDHQSPDYDLVVIGGGILGAFVVWLAAHAAPSASLALVEGRQIGSGITGASTGHCQPLGRNEELRSWAAESERMYSNLAQAFPQFPYWQMPLVVMARSPSFQDYYVKRPGRPDEATSLLQQDNIRVPSDSLLLGCVVSAICSPRRLTVMLFEELLRRHQLHAYTHCQAIGVDVKQKLQIALSDGRVLNARRVVIAAGTGSIESPIVSSSRFTTLKMKKIVSFYVPRAPGTATRGYYSFDPEVGLFARPDLNGWVLSIRSEVWDPSADTIDPSDLEIGRANLATLAPNWTETCLGGWVAKEGYPADGMPIVELAADAPGVVIVGACGGFGVRIAPSIAARALEAIGWGAIAQRL